ncbi:DUF4982 domain-containing protein, partial [Muribaculum sp.]|uniref:DUF4982 domain-containing protein n=1 Tax=Muribaculum sp. TaxID=1918611 RepID=UPI0023C0E3B4
RKTKKDAFYFYKANWNDTEPFVYISGRRHSRRTAPTATVTIFSNQPEVELIVNGQSIGRKKSDGFGTFTFDNVGLADGENVLTAKSTARKTDISDRVVWTLVR